MSNSFLPQSLSVSVCLRAKPFLHIFKCLLPTSSNLYSAVTSSQRVLFPQKHTLCPLHCPSCGSASVFFIAILATGSYIICLLVFFFFLILFSLTLQYCIGFAIYHSNEIRCLGTLFFPILFLLHIQSLEWCLAHQKIICEMKEYFTLSFF